MAAAPSNADAEYDVVVIGSGVGGYTAASPLPVGQLPQEPFRRAESARWPIGRMFSDSGPLTSALLEPPNLAADEYATY
jgi:hypothetical protein